MSAVDTAFHTPLPKKTDRTTRPRLRGVIGTLMCACLATAALLAAWGCSAAPVADGETLLTTRCSRCHSPERGRTARKTRDQWEQTVTSMIGKGAKVSRAEKAVLVDYLARTYTP